MKETAIERKSGRSPLKERGQYAIGFSVIALMLYIAGFPLFLLFFIGVLAFFIWKVFSTEARSETRRIFEFYLTSNEILREDDRRWYGFEIQDAIGRGERILRSMSTAPPLVYFTLGALYQKLDDHANAVKYLSQVVEEPGLSETGIVFPPRELREYVRTLRKIERFPAEAPVTSSAIRALERARRNRGKALLESSRSKAAAEENALPAAEKQLESVVVEEKPSGVPVDDAKTDQPTNVADFAPKAAFLFTGRSKKKRARDREMIDDHGERKTISEVLHDIYDKNVQ